MDTDVAPIPDATTGDPGSSASDVESFAATPAQATESKAGVEEGEAEATVEPAVEEPANASATAGEPVTEPAADPVVEQPVPAVEEATP